MRIEDGSIAWPGGADIDPLVLYGRYVLDPPVEFEHRVIREADRAPVGDPQR